MTRVLAATCFVLATLSLFALNPRSVLACSAGQDFDPVADSDIIVGGRITSWTRLPPPTPDPKSGDQAGFTPIALHMDVTDVFKGQAPAAFDFIDSGSLADLYMKGRTVSAGPAHPGRVARSSTTQPGATSSLECFAQTTAPITTISC